jgi:hypothetical protein
MTVEIEGGPGLVERRGLADAIEKHFVGVRVLHGEFEMSLASFRESVGVAESGKEVGAGAGADGAEKIVAVAVTLVKSRSGGCGRQGDAAHGERFFAASRPKPAGGVKNALFELRIRLSGQPVVSERKSLQGPTAFTIDYDTKTIYST